MTTAADAPILVTAATGKTGRRVADLLAAAGHAARRASRSSATPFDWNDDRTWQDAFAGARAAYLAFSPDLAVPGADDTVGRVAAAASALGVQHLVLLSGRGEPGAQRAEDAARSAHPLVTVVRSAWFVQNLTEGSFAEEVAAGRLVLPDTVVGVPEPFVDADDLASVAVAALTEPALAGSTYECTGPAAMTFAELVATLSAAQGDRLELTTVPLDAYLDAVGATGAAPEVLWLLRHLFGDLFDGRNSGLGDGVRQALGREARSAATAFAARGRSSVA